MRLKRPDQSERWRVAVFVAVVGLHVLAGLVLFAAGTIRIERLRAVDAPGDPRIAHSEVTRDVTDLPATNCRSCVTTMV
jgi:hypothetical protein